MSHFQRWILNSNFHSSSRDLRTRSREAQKPPITLNDIPTWESTYDKLQKESADTTSSSSNDEEAAAAEVEVEDVDAEEAEVSTSHKASDAAEDEEVEDGEDDEDMEDPSSSISYSDSGAALEVEEEEQMQFDISHPVNAELNKKIRLYQGDITRLQVDAVVNAANSGLWSGGGICGAIFNAACEWKLEKECKQIIKRSGKVNPGDSRLTKAYELPAKYIIHTVGPMNEDPKVLRAAYTSLLDTVVNPVMSVSGEKAGEIKTVAMCCISTGIYGMDNFTAANVALSTTRDWLDKNTERAKKIDSIIFCTFLQKDQLIYERLLPLYFPVEEPAEEEKHSEESSKKKDHHSSAAASSSSSSAHKHKSLKSGGSSVPSSSMDDLPPPSAAPLLTKRKSEEEMKNLETDPPKKQKLEEK